MFLSFGRSVQHVSYKNDFSSFLKQVEVILSSETAECPDSSKPIYKNMVMLKHIPRKTDRFSEYVIRDLIDGRVPAKITFSVQNWICDTCHRKFLDPAFKYGKNRKTTEDFLNYVAQRFMVSTDCNIQSLSKDFDISIDSVEVAIRKYRMRLEKVHRAFPHCDIIWMEEFDYRGSIHYILFGLVRHNSQSSKVPQEDLVLLGFSNPSFDAAAKLFHFNLVESIPESLFVSSDNILIKAKQQGHNVKILDREKWPTEFERIMELIEHFEEKKIRYDLLMTRLMFHNKYRLEEIVRQGAGNYIESTKRYITCCMRKSPRRKIDSVKNPGRSPERLQQMEKTFSCSSVSELLRSFEKSEDGKKETERIKNYSVEELPTEHGRY